MGHFQHSDDLRQLWSLDDKATASAFLDDWISRARCSGIRMLIDFSKTFMLHRNCILAWYDHPISTGPLERHKQQDQYTPKIGLWLQRSLILQTQNYGPSRNKVCINRMNRKSFNVDCFPNFLDMAEIGESESKYRLAIERIECYVSAASNMAGLFRGS
jgi:hypothetical protein